jgi:hypothetical protein
MGCRAALVLLLSIATVLHAKDKPKKDALLQQILHASTVTVVVYPRTDQFARTADFSDRQIAAEVETKVRSWKRFIFVPRAEEADIVIAVRTGAYAKPRVGVETRTSRPPQVGVGTEFGEDRDMLAVYRGGADAFDTSPLWRDLSPKGLALPTIPALERLKQALEEEEKKNSSSGP